jgi:replicative DNA helicase
VDGQTKDPSRFWYLPGPSNEHPAEVRDLEGDPLDVDAWLDRPEPAPARQATPALDAERQDRQASGDLYERARKYLAAMPGGMQGSRGSRETFVAACKMVHGFGLSDGDALALLEEVHNPLCVPRWSREELKRKVQQARDKARDLVGGVPNRPMASSASKATDDVGPVSSDWFDPVEAAEREAIASEPAEPKKPAAPVDEVRVLDVRTMLAEAAERADHREDVTNRCVTGVHELDDRTGGIQPGWCWVLGADTNWGKTTWAVGVADTNLRAGRGVLIVGVEDSEQLYADRLLLRRCCKTDETGRVLEFVNADNLRKRQLDQDERRMVRDVAERAEAKPLFLDARGRTAEWSARQVGRLLDAHKIDLVIYDYLQEFRSERRGLDRRNEVSEVAKMLRDPVKERSRACIILSQVTIQNEDRSNDPDGKKPKGNQLNKNSIRESRDVTNAAEVVALGFTSAIDIVVPGGKTIVHAGERAVLLDKVKQGRKGNVELRWHDGAAAFLDVPGPDDYLDNRARAVADDVGAGFDNAF